MRRIYFLPLTKTSVILLLAIAMIVFPQEVLSAASQGIWTWANYVVPALFPFFILSELLMGSGFVHLVGVLLEPVMRPIFALPGSAAFVLSMSFISGSPIGAVLTTKLHKENLLTVTEAEHLVSFTSNPSPGFMLGSVAAGMFADPALGFMLTFSVYLSNLLLGVGLSFFHRSTVKAAVNSSGIWRRAFRSMISAQRKDGRPLGQLIGDSVRNSINTILLVGGFVLLFAVLLRMLSVLGVLHILTIVLQQAGKPLGLDSSLNNALINGLFEVTLGCKAAVQNTAPLSQQILLVVAMLAWNGISIHGQVASFISGTGIRYKPFLIGRLIQTVLAVLIGLPFLHWHLSQQVLSLLNSYSTWQAELLAVTMAIFSTIILSFGLFFILPSLANAWRKLTHIRKKH